MNFSWNLIEKPWFEHFWRYRITFISPPASCSLRLIVFFHLKGSNSEELFSLNLLLKNLLFDTKIAKIGKWFKSMSIQEFRNVWIGMEKIVTFRISYEILENFKTWVSQLSPSATWPFPLAFSEIDSTCSCSSLSSFFSDSPDFEAADPLAKF